VTEVTTSVKFFDEFHQKACQKIWQTIKYVLFTLLMDNLIGQNFLSKTVPTGRKSVKISTKILLTGCQFLRTGRVCAFSPPFHFAGVCQHKMSDELCQFEKKNLGRALSQIPRYYLTSEF